MKLYELMITILNSSKTNGRCRDRCMHWRVVIILLIMAFLYSPINAIHNVAVGKSASQTDTGWGGTPMRAVDGNTNGRYNSGSCTHTRTSNYAWWKVDLGQTYVIEHVTLYNRRDCCGYRLQHVQLFVGLDDSHYKLHGYYAGIVGTSYTFHIPSGVHGRWVKITRVPGTETGQLQLCEVMVVGNIRRFRQDEGKIGTGAPLKSTQTSSKGICCIECKLTLRCVAVNYNSATGTCVQFGTVSTTSDSNDNNKFYKLD